MEVELQAFQLWIGIFSIFAADQMAPVSKSLNGQKHDAWLIGDVVEVQGKTTPVGSP